ncbi:copper amine oxidase 1 [Capronia epimyces CBS 606.96]|uniref:Amine oxidase n=1 Tax=Capronia epimyces CBS 606.96 TaxID=1182542 RepID=W9ZDU6_9EURO|nr:copper amine oxidase 1 [Capronia epimyces CBS 606.96]EXJ92699.1 copper amine oxidase 1 [Capronia epimyces CBS 606.96]
MPAHPLDTLSIEETHRARDLVASLHPDTVLSFREIYLEEPSKEELIQFLTAEHAGKNAAHPHRTALVQYDVIGSDRIPQYHESVIDLDEEKRISHVVLDESQHAGLTLSEFDTLVDVCKASQMFKDICAEIELPEGFEVIVEPWPYGGPFPDEENRRYFQGLCFARDTRSGNADSNFYAYPLPFIPVMDAHKREIIRVDRLATGGKGDSLDAKTHSKKIIDHCKASEYVPELLKNGPRKNLKPLNVLQPEGPSFSVDGSLIEWQNWRFRVGFNPREGAVIHDVHFAGRSVIYRLSISEMTVPYADPRGPFPRKQAFDFGDGGAGNCANNLSLGCDCLGVIKYFDAVTIGPDGAAKVAPNVVCLHEQDNGIGWKHTNWRTGRAVVTRNRELVVQFIITLANYEYIFAYKFDQAGGITVETRATGIVSVVNIDPGKTSAYGNVVSPGALAQNHQHVFCIRIDPAVDGYKNTVLTEESHRAPVNKETNPYGNFYEVRQAVLERSQHLDAAPQHNRIIKIVNKSRTNPISGKPVGYKFSPAPTQLLLADPESIQSKRALFAQHHVWVTKHLDGEFYAGGRYTLQSRNEIGGVADAIKRNEKIDDEDVVVWNVFGLTHNPRVEDWPVMPVEIHQLQIKPTDFFTENPAIDVPSTKNEASLLTNGATNGTTNGTSCCK